MKSFLALAAGVACAFADPEVAADTTSAPLRALGPHSHHHVPAGPIVVPVYIPVMQEPTKSPPPVVKKVTPTTFFPIAKTYVTPAPKKSPPPKKAPILAAPTKKGPSSVPSYPAQDYTYDIPSGSTPPTSSGPAATPVMCPIGQFYQCDVSGTSCGCQ
mmetsp:Transcript_43224/g.85233  ORF Transcript_43224/g.85233 Transcript_43224/m.85233 type:complete len:158 (+) Transcript_43224:196-669(+)